jgi:hypothetical protein
MPPEPEIHDQGVMSGPVDGELVLAAGRAGAVIPRMGRSGTGTHADRKSVPRFDPEEVNMALGAGEDAQGWSLHSSGEDQRAMAVRRAA